MRIRDGLESDAEALASLSGRPEDVLVDMIHDRSVRVAVPGIDGAEAGESSVNTDEPTVDPDEPTVDPEEPTVDPEEPTDDADGSAPVGFIAFDVRDDTVHVTNFAGSQAVIERLLKEPKRYAAGESMDLEVVVRDSDDSGINAVEAVGFESAGPGPRFEGHTTTRYRAQPDGSVSESSTHDK